MLTVEHMVTQSGRSGQGWQALGRTMSKQWNVIGYLDAESSNSAPAKAAAAGPIPHDDEG